ncbi:hypothetical protein [Arsenophonus nasoniae]|uniref:Uncharacterized protein n=2 Tax=Arsenophonus nasoniae TaxID=638 RepID=A0AA95GKZ2_9GAMM|nr:hypothetical protein [Arsenophonus nasoniae]WGM00918.1 hypothetical protein QE210_13835 [Arsenophonus nasoniae]
MQQKGGLTHNLFPEIDRTKLKTFSIEVDSYTVESALIAIEKAINEIKQGKASFNESKSQLTYRSSY